MRLLRCCWGVCCPPKAKWRITTSSAPTADYKPSRTTERKHECQFVLQQYLYLCQLACFVFLLFHRFRVSDKYSSQLSCLTTSVIDCCWPLMSLVMACNSWIGFGFSVVPAISTITTTSAICQSDLSGTSWFKNYIYNECKACYDGACVRVRQRIDTTLLR